MRESNQRESVSVRARARPPTYQGRYDDPRLTENLERDHGSVGVGKPPRAISLSLYQREYESQIDEMALAIALSYRW